MTLPHLTTKRLDISLLQPGRAQSMIDFLSANAAHFAPWDAALAPDYLELSHWQAQCETAKTEFAAGRSVKLVMSLLDDPERIIGTLNFTQLLGGAFQACFLGYRIGRDHEGQGLMQEALREALPFMFSAMAMHRIHANYMPANIRSGRLLARLGFVIEGYAKEYLFIDGAWRDHVLTSLTNAASTGALLMPSSIRIKK